MAVYIVGGFHSWRNQLPPLDDAEVADIAGQLHDIIKCNSSERASFPSGFSYRQEELKCVLAHEFARRHGWVAVDRVYGAQHLFGKRSPYHKRDLPPYQDHVSGCRLGRMPMAIVSQPYVDDEEHLREMRMWARERSLVFTIPVFPSWWYPGRTTLCVFSRKPLA